MNRNIRIAVSLGISAVFLYFAARGVHWGEAWKALISARYVYFLPMLACTVVTLYVRALRWRVLLRRVGDPSLRSLFDATNIGFMANMVLPLRMGEVIRPVMLSRMENQPLGSILATNVLERVFDLLTVVLLFGLSATQVGISTEIRDWGLRLCGIALLLALGVVFVRWQEAFALRILHTVLAPLPEKLAKPIESFFGGFVHALEVLSSPAEFLRMVGWTLVLWITICSIQGFCLLAFDMPVPVVLGSVVITAFTSIVISAPSAPGYIGAFQLGCTWALNLFNVHGDPTFASQAFAYSILLHLSQFVGVIGAGLFSLARGGISLRQLEEASVTDGRPT